MGFEQKFYRFQCNEQKAIVVAKAYATHEWDQLKSDALQIKPTSKPTLVRLVSSKLHVLWAFLNGVWGPCPPMWCLN